MLVVTGHLRGVCLTPEHNHRAVLTFSSVKGLTAFPGSKQPSCLERQLAFTVLIATG